MLLNGTTLYELYDYFSVSDEADKYQLFLSGPATGTLGGRMLNTGDSYSDLSGVSFSTLDRDHDRWYGGSCAVSYCGGGGWWYNNCQYANLNGPWSPAYWVYPWYPTLDNGRDIKKTVMMIRRH
ncbi:fibroleukin-like [Saccostrea cucullata]|uniref:fibroleukin-like n=1 Tax=Saccostrea cuccullata TaxID=36930 RepID=UPI002ED39E0C